MVCAAADGLADSHEWPQQICTAAKDNYFDITYARWRREAPMTPNRLTAIAFRWSISAVFTLCVFASSLKAQSAATAINGVYNGTYTCAIGPRTLKLSLLASGNGSLTGVFTFYLPPTSHTEAFSYSLNGMFDAAFGKFKLSPVKWETPPPGGYVMVGMDG